MICEVKIEYICYTLVSIDVVGLSMKEYMQLQVAVWYLQKKCVSLDMCFSVL